MEKVYLVRYGCYSDQGIAGVFSTEEKAKKYCEIHNEINGKYADPYWVDEWIVDLDVIRPEAKVVTYYVARIPLEDEWNANHTELWAKKGDFDPNEDGWTEKDIYSRDVVICKEKDQIVVYSVYSNEHAKKVAIEQYQIHTQQELENA